VMQYYKTRYVPNNLTFLVVGDVDAQKVRQQLTELFKPYPVPARARRGRSGVRHIRILLHSRRSRLIWH
jgi:zinc protease